MAVKYVFQMVIRHTNTFHSKALQNLPKLGFLVWKQTIWQPWWTRCRCTLFSWIFNYSSNIFLTVQNLRVASPVPLISVSWSLRRGCSQTGFGMKLRKLTVFSHPSYFEASWLTPPAKVRDVGSSCLQIQFCCVSIAKLFIVILTFLSFPYVQNHHN
jgi:hypothetical protein